MNDPPEIPLAWSADDLWADYQLYRRPSNPPRWAWMQVYPRPALWRRIVASLGLRLCLIAHRIPARPVDGYPRVDTNRAAE